MSGKKHVLVSAIKPLMQHLQRILLEDESDLTKNIKQQIFEYMDLKYDSSTEDPLNLCTFLDPRFKFDYIKDTLHI